MRRRLLVVLLLFSATAVTAFALPLLSSTAAERTQRLVISRTSDLDRFAALATGDRAALIAEISAYTAVYDEPVLVVDGQRRVVARSGDLDPADPALATALDAALRNQPAAPAPTVRPWSTDPVVFARPVGTGTGVAGVVVLRASTQRAAADVAVGWAWVLAGALAAALACALLAQVVARWLLRPLADLEGGVRAVASGQRRAHVAVGSGPRELRALSESFNRMSDAVAEAADQQRRLIADTSHQLRNPLAALRLRMDTLSARVGPDDTCGAAVAEVERLESLLDGLLALATADSTATEVAAGGREPALADLGAVVSDRADFWAAEADVPTGLAVLVRCPESDLAQVLDVLLDNAIKHGGGGRVTMGADRAAGTAWVEVADEGPGLPPDGLALATTRFWRGGTDSGGTGLGLAIADRLATARGGSLDLTPARPHGLRVRLTLPLEPPL
ncbi:HAMP domain-containing sensor histidine kinase [Umezawaea sp. Da 62-37]|uniref:sensor histidine kinase n=1 Tax=Umezawaea sp. Da 62-37 TaxID=3075927 RepID=UPI0028F6D871|nr:HAMP domain-containing sensor histidine kinase [Umezawaea sp. Da 62-37]WNV88729.1 HAMP domain-containing sensor histidine kinase [Umezawaea sp. Da 62-37]